MSTPIIEMTGQRFGRLVVVEIGPSVNGGGKKWLCRCNCGKEKYIRGGGLRSGRVQSCGCLAQENRTKHGKHKDPAYGSYKAMMQRCHNHTNHNYSRYGGRGTAVCDRWRNSIKDFLSDMGPRPSSEHSIDRIDNDKGYSPANCRWATASEQQRNTRSNVFTEELVVDVRQVAAQGGNIAGWAREHGINEVTAYDAASGRKWNGSNPT